MDELREHFLACRGNLVHLPDEFKKWKSLHEYRGDWLFLPTPLRDRVAEYNAMLDYHLSLNLWLNPFDVFYDRAKILLVQLIANIYEAVLTHELDQLLHEQANRDEFIAVLIDRSRLGPGNKYRTFGPIHRTAHKAGIINSTWEEHMVKVTEIRNWVHLARVENEEARQFLGEFTLEQWRHKLELFRRYIERRHN